MSGRPWSRFWEAYITQVMGGTLGHFKKAEVLIFGTALGFSHYMVHLMPIGTFLSEIDQYLDLPHRL